MAAHDVLVNYLPNATLTLAAARDASLAAIPDGQPKQDGMAVGAEAAAAMIAERAADGAQTPQFYPPAPAAPGVWQATPSCSPAGGVFLHVPNVTPFGLRSGDQFRAGPPPSLASRRYTRDYFEVKTLGRFDSPFRPRDRADVARFYAAVLGVSTWNPAVRQVAAAEGLSLTANARAFALLNMAIADGLIAVFDTKYAHPFWRPETAIRAGNTDGNPLTIRRSGLRAVRRPRRATRATRRLTAASPARSARSPSASSAAMATTSRCPMPPSPASPSATRGSRTSRTTSTMRASTAASTTASTRSGPGAMGRRVGSYLYRHHLRPRHRHDAQEDDVVPLDSEK